MASSSAAVAPWALLALAGTARSHGWGCGGFAFSRLRPRGGAGLPRAGPRRRRRLPLALPGLRRIADPALAVRDAARACGVGASSRSSAPPRRRRACWPRIALGLVLAAQRPRARTRRGDVRDRRCCSARPTRSRWRAVEIGHPEELLGGVPLRRRRAGRRCPQARLAGLLLGARASPTRRGPCSRSGPC